MVILRKTTVSRMTGYSVRHLERLEAAGRFPKRVKLGDRAAGWQESQVLDWLVNRVAASREIASPTPSPKGS